MTEEAQRLAIAKALGQKIDHIGASGQLYVEQSEHGSPNLMLFVLPDPLSDLNAMHEAEMALNMEQRGMMRAILYQTYPKGLVGEALHADAKKRAAAFLRAIGKWEDT